MQNYVIIVAGGKGLRMGSDVPKQFLRVGGKPILMHTLETFHSADDELRIILVLPAEQQSYWHELCNEHQFSVPHQIATGGETRFHSVGNGLALIPDGEEESVVGVHDGVRPFVSKEVILRCYEVAREQGTAIPVVPVVETLRQVLPEGDSLTVDRNLYRLVQTPQVFRVGILKEAYRQPYLPSFTDDASVVEALGHRIALVDGNRENVKITTPSDLIFAERLCSAIR